MKQRVCVLEQRGYDLGLCVCVLELRGCLLEQRICVLEKNACVWELGFVFRNREDGFWN